jgi:type IV secretory pathway VirB10-like protein
MAFHIKNLFSKRKQTKEEMDFEELGAKEEPEAIQDDVTKPSIPTGTFIEPKVLIGVGVCVAFLLTFVIAYGLQGPADKTSQQKAEEEFKKNQSSNYLSGPPDEIGKMAGSYSSLKDQNAKGKKQDPNENANAANARYNNQGSQASALDQRVYTNPRLTSPISPVPNQSFMPLQTNFRQSPEEKELAEALKSAIGFGTQGGAAKSPIANAMEKLGVPGLMSNASAAPLSDQEKKVNFLRENSNGNGNSFYTHSSLQESVSQFDVKAGTIIPGVMITGINSDLPGDIVAQVRENVYDSTTGQYLLIPLGSKLIGTYDSNMSYGQNRVLVVWNRLLLPNGESLALEGMVGTDLSGYSGFSGRKNDHIPRILNGVILGSLLTAGARVATGGSGDSDSYSQQVGQGIAENIAQSAAKITEKNLNVQPTIEIDPGYAFNVFVNKDLILKPYQY